MSSPGTQIAPADIAALPARGNGDARQKSTPPRAFDRAELAFLVGVPLLWALLLLFHPAGDATEMYATLRDELTPWLAVHLGMLLFIPLMAAAVYVLLRGVGGTAARVSRIALAPFVVFYGAFETLQGIGNGVLAHQVNGLPEAQRATGSELVQGFGENILIRDLGVFSSLGGLAFIVAAIAAGIALHRHARAPVSVAVLLALAGFLITAHPPPFGPTGLALFIVAVLIVARSRGGTTRPAVIPEAQPTAR
jgi:hypothetical protein